MSESDQQVLITDELYNTSITKLENSDVIKSSSRKITIINSEQVNIEKTQQITNSSATDSITALLNSLFPEQDHEEKELRHIKNILGELTSKLTPEELHVMVCEVRYLVENWLDEYETIMLKGKTLKEVLNEG